MDGLEVQVILADCNIGEAQEMPMRLLASDSPDRWIPRFLGPFIFISLRKFHASRAFAFTMTKSFDQSSEL